MSDHPANERTNEQPTVEQVHAQFLAHRIAEVADRLRRLADTADRLSADIGEVGRTNHYASYAEVAAELQHDLLWGLANMHLDGLTTQAQRADEYRCRTRDAEQIAKRIEAKAQQIKDVAANPADVLDRAAAVGEGARIAREYGKEG